MSIKIINGGLLTTVQDEGRYGLQASGMQVSGAMDMPAAALANLLVGNDELADTAAVLETTYLGPELEFQADGLAAVTGGIPDVRLDGQCVQPYRTLAVKKGQHLKIGAQSCGMRAYIAVAGGFAVPKVLGSRATNLKLGIGGWQGRKLTAGDILPVGELPGYAEDVLAGKKRLRQAEAPGCAPEAREIRAVLGPQEDYFTQEEITAFCRETYTVSHESDRMGYRLQGRPVQKAKQQDLITDGIVFGSIQIPPNGQPIIMLADHQTTGGYPKLATVAGVDLPELAQAMPGTKLRFKMITVQEAQELLRRRHRKQLAELAGVKAGGEMPLYSSKARRYNLKISGEIFEVVVDPVD